MNVISALCLLNTVAGCDDVASDSAGELTTSVSPLGDGTFEEVTGFGSNPGALKMYRYVPLEQPMNAPLVLALHACTQTAQDYRRSGWERLADEFGFFVVYPEQQLANNAMRCFNWSGEYGDAANLQRGEGENQSIVSMVDQMIADYSIDEGRVFVVGHSGGGAQAALMLAVWPDVFAGGATIAGIPYNCTTEFLEVYSCLQPGIDRTAEQWGDRVRAAYSDYSGPYPVVSIWQGTSDAVVNYANLTELIEQWTDVHGIDSVADVDDDIDGYPRRAYQNDVGETLVETVSITGAGHGTFVDPDNDCGDLGSYLIDEDICSAYHIADFFGLIHGDEPIVDPDPESDVGITDAGVDWGVDSAPDPRPDPRPDVWTDSAVGRQPDMGGDVADSDDDTSCDCQCPSVNDSGCQIVEADHSSSLWWALLFWATICLGRRTPSVTPTSEASRT